MRGIMVNVFYVRMYVRLVGLVFTGLSIRKWFNGWWIIELVFDIHFWLGYLNGLTIFVSLRMGKRFYTNFILDT